MKKDFNTALRFGLAALAVSSVCLSDTAMGQNPLPYGGSRRTTASPAPPAAGPADTTAPQSTTSEKTKKGGNLSSQDRKFMMNAAKGGTMEVEWGRIAAKNGQSSDVKSFGNRMVTDHTKANNELMSLAQEEGVKLPNEKVNGKWKSDKDYMDMMVKDHEKDLAEFEGEAKDGSDADLKNFAEKTSKVVRKHLELAKEIQGKLK